MVNDTPAESIDRSARAQVSRKVDFQIFGWVIGILSGIMLIISGYLFTEIAAERTARAELGAKLDAEKDKNTAVLISLEQIRGEMRLMRDQLERTTSRLR